MIRQYNGLEHNARRLLNFTGIIMIEPVCMTLIDREVKELILPSIVISKNIVPGFLNRYKIAHYIRNQLSYFFYYEMDPYPPLGIEDGTPYYFPEYEEYIKKNAKLICNVIYHFFSEKYYGAYKMMGGLFSYLLIDDLLDEHLDLLYKKLENEIRYINNYLEAHSGESLLKRKERHNKERLDR